jgi:hypothetical protein
MGKAKSRGTRRPAVKSAVAKNPTPQERRRTSAVAESQRPAPSKRATMMMSPLQTPPVEREYLRALVGRKGKPISPSESGGSGKKAKKDQVGDYFVQLATFHVLPNRRT